MKISKVDHRKTAVGVIKSQGTKGIIYQDPTREKTNVEQIVNKRTSSTQILYNVFDVGELKKDVSKDAKNLAKTFNRGLTSLKVNKRNKHNEEINNNLSAERLLNALIDANSYNNKFSEEVIDEVLNMLLKKNFKASSSKVSLRILLEVAYGSKGKKSLTQEESKQIKKDFISKLVNDYTKASVVANTPKALKNQNMVIQPGKNDYVLLPAQNNRSSERKRSSQIFYAGIFSN